MCQMSKHIDHLVDIDGTGFSSRFNKKKSKKSSRPLENIIPQRITKAEKQQVIRRNFERSRKDDSFYHFSEDAEVHNIKSPYKTNRLHSLPRLEELKIGIKSPYRKNSFASTLPAGLLSPLNPNCITPHKDQLSLNTRLDPDNQIENQSSIVHTIFIALFGKNEVKSSPFGFKRHYYNPLDDDDDDDDDDEDENEKPNNKNNIQIEPVDEIWFKSLISTQLFSSPSKDLSGKFSHPSNASTIKKNSPNQIEFPVIIKPQQILSTYMNTSFVRTLVNELCHEDDRFSSPRVSVLQALYKQCPHLRHTISQSLYEVTYARYLRCCITQSHSSSLEVDHNRLASLGLMDYLPATPSTHTTATSASASLLHQDSLLQSTAISLCTQPTRPCPSSVTSHPATPTRKPAPSTSSLPASTPPITRDHDGSIIELLRLAISVELPSPATPTTMSTTPDDSEDRHMLPSSSFPSPQHSHSNHIPDTPETDTSNTTTTSSIDFLLRVAMNVLRCYGSSLGSVGEHADKPELLVQLLLCFESLLKYPGMSAKASSLLCNQWPKFGQGFECAARRIAYVRVAQLLLQLSPPPVSTSCVTGATGKREIRPASELKLPKISRSTMNTTTTTGSTNIAILTKIITAISSSHFKLAVACLNVCSDPLILDTYLLSPSCRTQLECLVDALRVNRSHWHHLVVFSSEQLFDILLDRME